MGYLESAQRQVRMVPAASARMLCDMQCRLTTAHREVDQGRIEPVVMLLGEIENILYRAIECGAMVDPWNILGFGGQFSLFPSPENSIHDFRVDELINLMSDIFALYIRAGKEAAALGNNSAQAALAKQLERLTDWWNKFATTEVSEVGGISGRDTFDSAEQVASALAPGIRPAQRRAILPFGAGTWRISAPLSLTPWSSKPCSITATWWPRRPC